MKKHNVLKVILLMILITIVCTWIFPSAGYQYEFVKGEMVQLGIFDLCTYIVQVLFPYFSYVVLMVLAIGMFYGVSYKIPAYRELLDKIVSGFKGKENIFLATVMSLIAIIVSVTGLSFGILFVFPFVISVVLLMGYNKLVAASVTVGSTVVGLLGTTLGSSTTYYINVILSTDVFSEIITKVILLVVGLLLLVYNVLCYANKTKNNTDKVVELVPNANKATKSLEKKVVKETVEKAETSKNKKKTTSKKKEDTKTKTKAKTKEKDSASKSTKTAKKTTKTRANDLKSETTLVVSSKKKTIIWPYVVVFDLVLIILAVSTFNWVEVLDIDWFNKALAAVQEYTIADFPIFDKLFGSVQPFGEWSNNYEIPTFIFLATCYIGFMYGLKFDDFLDGVIEGIKKAIKPAIYMFIVYLVVIIGINNPFQLHFTNFLVNLTDGLNVITMTIAVMISSIFGVECQYVAQTTLPYVAGVVADNTLFPLLGVIFQSVYGLMMLIAPTSVILLGTLTYLDISYTQWIKHIWKLFLQLLLVLVIVFLILFLI